MAQKYSLYDEWAVCRRYMPVEKLSGLCDDHEQEAMIAAD
jgi:hypothetical protein